MKLRRGMVFGLTAVAALSLMACGGAKTESAKTESTKTEGTETGSKNSFSVAMITDTGGINDQSFNQSAWEGLTELKKEKGVEVNYIESKQASDFVTNLERLGDSGANLLWGVGYACSDAVLEAAGSNPDIQYAIIDNAYDDTPDNVTGVMFRAQEPSFLVGYVAGRMTETGRVGFVGGISSGLIDQFQYGYEAGVKYAAGELGKDIDISVQYAESFSDAAKGKAIATKMYSDGCDVIYHAAGGSGTGVIEAAKEAGKWVIGVDRDQSYLAPENVLTSALKLVGKAVKEVSVEAIDGQKIGGQTLTFGLKEECVGIPEEHGNMTDGVYEDTLKVADAIRNGELVPPAAKEEYEVFIPTKDIRLSLSDVN